MRGAQIAFRATRSMMPAVVRKKREAPNEKRGERFQAAREHARLSQPAAAGLFGVSPTTVYWWEKGASPKGVEPEAIAARYGVRVAWLMFGDGAMLTGGAAPIAEPLPGDGHGTVPETTPEPRVERTDELTGPELRELLEELGATDEEIEKVREKFARDAFLGGWTRDRVKGLLEGLRLASKPAPPQCDPNTDEQDAARAANERKGVRPLKKPEPPSGMRKIHRPGEHDDEDNGGTLPDKGKKRGR